MSQAPWLSVRPTMLAFRTLLLAALPAVLLACAPAQPAAAPSLAAATAPLEATYRSVHIDTIAPGKMEQFEGARRAWIEEMKRAHANDGRGLFMQVGTNRFYTIRSFAQFGDFDTRGA